MSRRRRVVITGLGIASPTGLGVEPFWEALLAGRCGIRHTESYDPAGMPVRIAGELAPFKLGDYIPKTYRKSAKVMSRDIMIAVMCAYFAVRDAKLVTKCIVERGEAEGPPTIDSVRFGANIGAGLICADLPELAGALCTATENGEFSLKKWGTEGMGNLTPLWLLKFLPNMLACHVTIVHDAQAPSNTLTCGEASSHLAIGEAFRTILRGDADVCICGGSESKCNPMASARPTLLGRLNADSNDAPEAACRPFGVQRNGCVPAEGGGLIILESLDHALSRQARIYAELSGFGAASNSVHWRDPDPKGMAIGLALTKAMADAGVRREQIDLANPFGTGIDAPDASEMAGWNEAVGDRLNEIPALTTRGATGNNGAGSGAIELAATIMALNQRTVPTSVNTDDPDPNSPFQFVQGDPIDANITHALSMGYALGGGQTAALLIKRYEE